MLSVCTKEFLSHPIEDKKHSLIEHLLEVAKKSDELFSQTKFVNRSLAYYSGLLHDIGKINPFYQEIFHETKNRKKVEEKMLEKYVQEHSRFSSRIADIVLQKSGLNYEIIEKLYKASQEGVRIRMIVRGICCLVPGIKGLSENIEVISILDKFLEHPRVYIFENSGQRKVYISSADFMTRNLENRVEVSCPIYDSNLQKEIIDVCRAQDFSPEKLKDILRQRYGG